MHAYIHAHAKIHAMHTRAHRLMIYIQAHMHTHTHREHAESLVISNDVLREELRRAKDQSMRDADRAGRLEASAAHLETSLAAANATLSKSKKEINEALGARDVAVKAQQDAISALERDRVTQALRIEEIKAKADDALTLQVTSQPFHGLCITCLKITLYQRDD
jgi:hypothetical protein